MKKIKSVVTFIRKITKSKGKSGHNGRGCVEMRFDKSFDEIKAIFESKIEDWCANDLIQTYNFTNDKIEIEFNKEVVEDQYYRTFVGVKHEQYGNYFGVRFTL